MIPIAILWLTTAATGGFGATVSGDSGKTCAPPLKGLNIPGKPDADSSLMWDGQRACVFSTTVRAIHTRIESSPMFVATSADGSGWTAPREIRLPFAYSVGKRHMVVRLIDGSYSMPTSWWQAQRKEEGHHIRWAGFTRDWAPGK
jgi:hypothetical protein